MLRVEMRRAAELASEHDLLDSDHVPLGHVTVHSLLGTESLFQRRYRLLRAKCDQQQPGVFDALYKSWNSRLSPRKAMISQCPLWPRRTAGRTKSRQSSAKPSIFWPFASLTDSRTLRLPSACGAC